VIGFFTLLLLTMLAWGLHRVRMTATTGSDVTAMQPRRPQVLATPPSS